MTRLAAAAAGLLATLALAQPAAPSLALDYEAPAECPSASDVFADVKRLRGELTRQSATPDVRARVRMLPSGPRWNAEVETFSRAGAGRRKLEADTCQRAAQAVAVVLALALANPLAPLPAPPGPPPIEPVVEAVRQKVVPFVNLLGAARFGVLPNPMPLAQLGGGVEAGWLRIELRLGLAARWRASRCEASCGEGSASCSTPLDRTLADGAQTRSRPLPSAKNGPSSTACSPSSPTSSARSSCSPNWSS